MRIADVLTDGQDETAEKEMKRMRRKKEKSPRLQCLSPRMLFCRWMPKRSEKQESKRSDGGDQALANDEEVEVMRGESRVDDVSGEHAKRDCVNLAVGFGLFYLIAASKNELSKMIELRRDMELFVQSAKDEFQTQTRKTLYEPSESNYNHNFSPIDTQESLHSDGHFSLHNLSYENHTETLTSYSCNQSLTINTNSHGKCVEGMDRLEAELETELERMQVHLDTSNYPKSQRRKMLIDDISSEGSSSVSFVEAIDVQEGDATGEFGVCPHELERRLHELLESRQKDEIEELEAILKSANQKLLEREKEVSWWKETARIFSHHVPRASRLSRLGQSSHRVI